MARPKNTTPTYKLHSSTGLARCWVNGRWVTLGKYGSPESRAEFARIVAELDAAPGADPTGTPAAAVTLDALLVAYWSHVEQHYRAPDGGPTTEVEEIRRSLAPVQRLYGHTPAAGFGPKALTAARQEMIKAGWCRTLINRRVERIRRAFRWAASQELVPVTTYQALRTVPGLQKGRTTARESEPVKPVALSTVQATLPHVSRHVRAMIELQLCTGMRPGEVCALTFAEVDTSGELWAYRPERHKTAHRGKGRVVFLGPKARAVLVAFLTDGKLPPEGFAHVELNNHDHSTARLILADAYQEAGREHDAALLRDLGRPLVLVGGCVVDPSAPVFSPAREREERFRKMRAARKSKVSPSQVSRKKANPKRKPAKVYHPHAYSAAVEKACKREGLEHWHPNQIRHTHGTEVRKRFGIEGAQVALGHAHAAVSEVYAERNNALAARIAAEMG